MASNGDGKSPSTSSTVKFNVGGKVYEVSKSLLEGFPDTILAKKASSSISPIFIDRDPDRFAYCLDYMRDNGNVSLPETASKVALLKELEFFGFVDIDETKIIDETSKLNLFTRFHQFTEATIQRIAHLEKEAKIMEGDLERRKVEIKLEKVLLKCLAASVDSTGEYFSVDYSRDIEVPYVHDDQYFIDCCDKIALCINRRSSFPWAICLRRKTKAEGEE